MATIDEIARRANVSKTTVSFVINGRPGPSAETTALVRRVMKEMDYVPSRLAQRFASQSSKTVALVCLSYPYVFSDIHHGQALDAVHETLNAFGYSLLLATSNAQFIEERRYSLMLRSGHVDGMLLLEPTLDQAYLGELAADEAPVVLINSDGSHVGLEYVRTDDFAVGRLAAEHLLKLGHRHVGLVAGDASHASARDRQRGFRETLEAAGVPLRVTQVFHGTYDTSHWSGYQGCMQILADCPDTTALFCCNDTMAIGALDAASKVNRAVPRTLSLIGVDDNPISSYCTPPLTSIRQPSYEIAKEATHLLLDRLMQKTEPPDKPKGRLLDPEFVERESTAPPP
jgi:LacI family transcriptional regulator